MGGQHTAARRTAALGAGAVGGVALFAVALPAVRAWPPERLRAHDPATLGVYPPRDRDGNPQPYRPRAEDAELDQALAGDAQIVVVGGPAGGGKSRAAAEAARRKLPVVPAIVPVDAAALGTLADNGVRLNGRESCVCLWLDGLDRFIEVLDPRMLGVLAAIFGSEDALTQPPPLSEQMDKVKAEALRGDGAGRRHVVLDERVRLHQAEADSWILVLEDRPSHDAFYAGAANGVGPPPHSNELRIYDVRGGRLHLALRFQPPGVGRTAAEWRELNARPLGKDYDLDAPTR